MTFRTSAKEAQYLRDLPLHSSQCEESSDGDNVTFSIFVCTKDSKGNIYRDLIMELCRYGSRIEVLSPADIRDAVWQEFKKAENIYHARLPELSLNSLRIHPITDSFVVSYKVPSSFWTMMWR